MHQHHKPVPTAFVFVYSIVDPEGEVFSYGVSPTLDHAKDCIFESLLDVIPMQCGEDEDRLETTVQDARLSSLTNGMVIGSRENRFRVYCSQTSLALTEDVLIASR